MDERKNVRPLLLEESLSLAGEQQQPRAVADVHAATAAFVDQPFVDELLVSLQDGERIQAVIRGYRPHGGQWIALLERSFQDEGNHPIAQLAIDRLIVVPMGIHLASGSPCVRAV